MSKQLTRNGSTTRPSERSGGHSLWSSLAPRARTGVIAVLLAAPLLLPLISSPTANAATRTFAGISVTTDGNGYVLMSTAGEAYAFNMPYRDNPRGFSGRIVSVAATADGKGYAAVSSTGQVYAYGTVTYRGNPKGFSGEIAEISVTANGSGYIVVSTAGQVYAYNVPYRGNASGFSGRITGASLTGDGSGYHLISSTGQVYAFNTRYVANPVGFSGEIVSISSTGNGSGYYAISSAGQVYAYGTAQYHQNPAGFSGQIVGISARADGRGYAALSSTGQVYAYGTVYRGNGDPGTPDETPVVAPGSPPPAGGVPAVSQVCVDFVKSFEGFSSTPYWDNAGKVWTIGYGYTIGVTRGSPPITVAEATVLLRKTLNQRFLPAIRAIGTYPRMRQNQVDALASFIYNVGPGAINGKTKLGKALRAADWGAAANAMLSWDKAGGRRLPGLTRRRQAERAMFLGRI